LKTRYGFAGLHNVNRPWDRRNDMPSFFLAETLKYFFLLFANDAALSLHRTVLSTEAHPLPTLEAVQSEWGVPWLCRDEVRPEETHAKWAAASEAERASETATDVSGEDDKQDQNLDENEEEVILEEDMKKKEENEMKEEVAKEEREEEEEHEMQDENQQEEAVTVDISNPNSSNTEAENSEVVATSLLGSGSGCYVRERKIRDSLVLAEIQLQRCTSTLASLQGFSEETQLLTSAPARNHQSLLTFGQNGDPSCWAGAHTPQVCCWPPRLGNHLCWDGVYTYARCCIGGQSSQNSSRS